MKGDSVSFPEKDCPFLIYSSISNIHLLIAMQSWNAAGSYGTKRKLPKVEGLIFGLDPKERKVTETIWKTQLVAECPSFSLLCKQKLNFNSLFRNICSVRG